MIKPLLWLWAILRAEALWKGLGRWITEALRLWLELQAEDAVVIAA